MAKSFSIRVGADTSDFIKDLKKADRQIKTTAKLGDELNKSLDLKFNPDVAIQAQKSYQTALTQTEEKADALRKQMKILEDAGQVDTQNYEKLQTELAKSEAEAEKLRKKLDEVGKAKIEEIAGKFEKVGDAIEKAGKKIAPFSALAAGAIAGGAKLAKDAVSAGDDIATLAQKYDMSTTAIQRWQYVAMQSDVSAENLYKAAQKVQGAIGDQMTGATNAAVQALDRLGISYENFDSNEQAFEAIVKAMSGIENQAELASIASDIFGERFGTELIPLFRQGEDAVNSYIAEFKDVGYLSEETVDQLANLDNEINKVTKQFELSKIELGVAMIPVYMALIDILQNYVIPAVKRLAEWFDNLGPAGQRVVIAGLAIIGVLAPMLILIGKVTNGIGAMIKILPALKTMLEKVEWASWKTYAGFAALGGALMLGLDLIFNWQKMSAVEKILKSLATAALIAAAAVSVFHASWSVGIAVGAIVAGIAAAIGAIKAAGDKIGIDTGFDSADGLSSSLSAGNYNAREYDYKSEAIKKELASGQTYSNTDNSTVDNSTNTYNIYVDSNEYVSADEIVDIVSKKIATLSSARG